MAMAKFNKSDAKLLNVQWGALNAEEKTLLAKWEKVVQAKYPEVWQPHPPPPPLVAPPSTQSLLKLSSAKTFGQVFWQDHHFWTSSVNGNGNTALPPASPILVSALATHLTSSHLRLLCAAASSVILNKKN